MFRQTKAFSGFSVDDIPAAKAFYAETLGLEVTEQNGMLTLQIASGHGVLVYPKQDHVPAEYTVLNFPVDDITAAVRALAERGIRFERYGDDQDELGIARNEGPPIAWFKDPAGNVLSVIEQ
ncbi:Glyoxalase/bleomycin resistance protein/dioxygenase [Kribbella flavida DSM 17836]|uniref:Glyoxalase/bleomycin resistance protein/dioxygenase n=1 Tax=Kribbella flavida (strain DSM 17836 / JCM 10339 / NBRC 14399) TaxID=479435 RepID=D2Q3R5_KRIFD|nr:VOC family protein [Kribbella flavida]ADB35937.1 Glyoxalase/bleomycin resistance protein/dioxygenase [Kribbella flavida DSM 17836]